MGKRCNRNKNKKLLKNSGSDKKPCAQDDTHERKAEQKCISKLKNSDSEKKYVSVGQDNIKSRQIEIKKYSKYEHINKNEYNLCEDLFHSSSDDDFDPEYFKQILNIDESYRRRRKKENDDINHLETVISEEFKNVSQETSSSKIHEIKKQSNEQKNVSDKVVILKHEDAINSLLDSRSILQHNAGSKMSGARPKHVRETDYVEEEYKRNSFHEYNYSSKSSDEYEERKNFNEKLHSNEITSKENFISHVNEYGHSKNSFSIIYHKWMPQRLSTLEKLGSLYEEVRSGRLKYNETQSQLKEFSSQTRIAKVTTDSMLVGFLASAMTLVADATSGVTSFAQAYNTDLYQNKFQEIMDHDAEYTKELYEIRSQCIKEYQGIEEVMRKFHADTFSSTVSKISDTLEVGKYWEAMKNAYRKDDMSSLMDIVGNFFNNACQSEVLGKVCDSIDTYTANNPAALEGCMSTGTALYEYVNVWSPIYTRKSIRGRLDTTVSTYLSRTDTEKVICLKYESNEHCRESKLESQIRDAIDSLKSEMNEIESTYNNLFKNETNEFEIFSD